MIDIQSEQLITLSEAAALVGGVHKNTACRWALVGVKGVKLETLMRGGRRMTSSAAVQRFLERTTAAVDGEPIPTRTHRRRQRDVAKAEAELAAEDI